MTMKKLIVSNWKMNPPTVKEAVSIVTPLKSTAQKARKVTVVVCPPHVFIERISDRFAQHIKVGAQDVFWETKGAYTGEVSPAMLKKMDVSYVIVGHSERRGLGETNMIVAQKVRAALDYRMRVILCIGEESRDDEGTYLEFLRTEITESLQFVQEEKDFLRIAIAYEPIWAIGDHARGAATPEDFLEKSIFIRKVIDSIAGAEVAQRIQILYGGSVNEENAEGFLREGKAQGLLIGRASRDPKTFKKIIGIAEEL